MKNVTPTANSVSESNERLLAGITYVLFLIGPANGVSMLIAAIIAWFRRDKAPQWLATHYEFQLHTVIYAIALLVVAFICLLTVILIPVAVVIYLLWTLWVIVRVIVGLIRLIDGRPNPDPTTFWF
ncbi:hypothetical protein [Hyphobacterium sp.]|uniref:hypothetical protein n=1 Tax=Hyphobacterium sp. TaxID=2004662 RepID=UPI003BAB1C81